MSFVLQIVLHFSKPQPRILPIK